MHTPQKVQCLTWRLLQNRLPSKEILIKMGVHIQSKQCPFCQEEEECSNHIIFYCSKSYQIWCTFHQQLNEVTILLTSPIAHFLQQPGSLSSKNKWCSQVGALDLCCMEHMEDEKPLYIQTRGVSLESSCSRYFFFHVVLDEKFIPV